MRSMPQKENNRSGKQLKTDYKSTVWTVVGLSLLAIIGAAYFFFGRDFGGVAINIEAEEPARIGEPFDVSVTLENKTDEEVTQASVSLSLPQGVAFADGRGDLRRTAEVETIPAGAFERETFSVVITEFSDDKIFRAEAEYLPASLGRSIKASKELQIKVQKWLSLNIEAPDKIVSGEEFEWIFSYENDTDKDWTIDLELEFPEELLGDMPGERFKIAAHERNSQVYTASIIMEEGRSFEIKAAAKGDIEGEEYILGDARAETVIAPSPLSINISSAKGDEDPLYPGEEIGYAISFRNNSDTAMKDIRIEAEFEGEMFDVPSRTLNWTVAEFPEFAEIGPGKSSSVNFSAKIAGDYPIKRLNDKDFSVRVNVRIESPTVPYALKSLKTVNIDSIQQKIAGKAEVSAKALYRDAASGVINEGIFPPAVGQPTEYSIHWGITSYSTDMSEVEVSAEIPPGVEFVRQVKVDAGEFTSDPERKLVIWKIPKILATTGILNKPVSAVFQVRATPEQAHAGSYMPILGPTNITAKDDFTGTVFTSFKEFLTTELPEDKTVNSGEGTIR